MKCMMSTCKLLTRPACNVRDAPIAVSRQILVLIWEFLQKSIKTSKAFLQLKNIHYIKYILFGLGLKVLNFIIIFFSTGIFYILQVNDQKLHLFILFFSFFLNRSKIKKITMLRSIFLCHISLKYSAAASIIILFRIQNIKDNKSFKGATTSCSYAA